MNTLFLDIGNSRIKWTVDGGDDAGTSGAQVHDGAVRESVDALVTRYAPSRIVVVDVTGTVVDEVGGIPVTALRAEAQACGVTNGYSEPTQLGADRWAALIGARALDMVPAVIVDAGTALTVDFLAADGRHLGGWIVPGLTMSRQAFHGGTRGVRVPDLVEADPDVPGTDTASAVAGGIVAAAVGAVEHARRVATARFGKTSTLVVTGGDATHLMPFMPNAVRVDDLVLQGLKFWEGAAG